MIISLMIFFSLLGNQPAASPATLTKWKFALNWVPEPEFGGFYAAQYEGLYKNEGLDIEMIPGGAGSPTIQMVAAGQVDIAVSSASEVLISRERGADVVSTFAVYQTSPLGIMVHKSRGLKNIKEVFESGTLSIEKGQAFSLYLEKKYGYSKVKVVPYAGGVTNFLRDKDFAQQCFVFSEPILAENEGVDAQTFLIADAGYNPYIEVVAMRSDFLAKNKELVKKFLRATQKGWEIYLKDPKPTNLKMSKLNKAMSIKNFDKGAIAQASLIETSLTKKNGLGFMEASRWKELGDQLVKFKILKKSDADSAFFNF